ncbi:MAG: hypothetical protein KDK34_18810, partial [Leptospiraceae bacterium]|nr:hypothetical protein [Leptospiraceae bacterium]
MRTLLHISSYILIAMISNALVVLSIGSFLGDLIYFRDGRVLYLTVIRADPLYDFIVNASLFPVALIFILFYLAPIRHLYNDTASDSSAYRRGVRRMLNAPLAISAVAIVGWIAGNAMMYMIYYYEGIHIGAFYIFTNMITMVILSLLTFV